MFFGCVQLATFPALKLFALLNSHSTFSVVSFFAIFFSQMSFVHFPLKDPITESQLKQLACQQQRIKRVSAAPQSHHGI